jgi:hypothetical protein
MGLIMELLLKTEEMQKKITDKTILFGYIIREILFY